MQQAEVKKRGRQARMQPTIEESMTATNGANGAHGESGATEGHTNQQDTAFSTDA